MTQADWALLPENLVEVGRQLRRTDLAMPDDLCAVVVFYRRVSKALTAQLESMDPSVRDGPWRTPRAWACVCLQRAVKLAIPRCPKTPLLEMMASDAFRMFASQHDGHIALPVKQGPEETCWRELVGSTRGAVVFRNLHLVKMITVPEAYEALLRLHASPLELCKRLSMIAKRI